MSSMHRLAGLVLLAGAGAGAGASASGQQPPSSSAGRVTRIGFTESTAVLPNPERGFYRSAQRDLEKLDSAFLDAAYQEGFRLIYARLDLGPYRSGRLPAAYLDQLDSGFAAARRAGVKLIVRAAYNYPRGETEYRDAKDAPLAVVLGHIAQLKPVLGANADVIAFLQAGFVGAWGEWHTSSNGLTEPAARAAIRDALLAAAPADRFVQFRYPPYIIEWTGRSPDAPASGLRIGFHNDCFLASRTDVGTYDEDAGVRAAQQEHMARLGDVAPFGGETCNPADAPGAAPRTRCADVLGEGARYNLVYLNHGYYRRLFHDSWIAEGCHDDVARRMGHRLRLIDAAHPDQAMPGGRFAVTVNLRNDGWARLFNPRAVEILLRNRATGAMLRLPAAAVDPRQWLPGATSRASLDVALPPDAAAGTYDVLIAMPDASPRLRTDPRYAIRPANADDPARGQRWHAASGAFQLGSTVRVAPLSQGLSNS